MWNNIFRFHCQFGIAVAYFFVDLISITLFFSWNNIFQVSLSIWEQGSPQPSLDYSVDIDPLYSVSRNPFSEKKWKKFQLSSLFSSSNSAIKLQVIDVNFWKQGTKVVDRWLVVLSLGSGQTRNMALDRYIARWIELCTVSNFIFPTPQGEWSSFDTPGGHRK